MDKIDLIERIESRIDNKIAITERNLEEEIDESKKQFLRGQITGLLLAKITLPLKETMID